MKKILSRGSSGFTLIELLIVIVIIVIVVTIGVVSYTTVSRNARDAQRKSDLAKIADALERSFADFGYYPASGITARLYIPNTLLNCFNTGLPTGAGITPQIYIPLSHGNIANAQYYKNTQFRCQNLYTEELKVYMDETPKDPLDTKAPCPTAGSCNTSTANEHPVYNYFSFDDEGMLCYDVSVNFCPQDAVLPDNSDWKPVAYKYKLVAVMENESNATNAPGDQDPVDLVNNNGGICRKPGYCYVVPSPNF